MKFEELDKKCQDNLIGKIESAIYTYLELSHMDGDIELPSQDEYVEFFDLYDEDYEIDQNGFAKSVVPNELHSNYDVEIKNCKVILKVCQKNV